MAEFQRGKFREQAKGWKGGKRIDKQGRKMFDNLGGTLITNNEGHMGSDSFNQPYKEFPFLLRMVE